MYLSLFSFLMIPDREYLQLTQYIMAVRAGSEQGSTAVRSFKVPEMVNLDACDLYALIDWEKETITEPVFTGNMSLAQLDALKVSPWSFLHIQYTLKVVRDQ